MCIVVFCLWVGCSEKGAVVLPVAPPLAHKRLASPILGSFTSSIDWPGSSVGTATDYGLDGPGIESWWGEIFPPVQTGPGAHPTSCTMGTGSFPGANNGRGVLLTTHPLLIPRSWKSRAIPLPTLWATTGPVTGTL